MIKKIEKFEMLKNDKKNFNKNYLYSQIIKNERTKRRLTLSEMAKGICSISYLCKFERNTIVADENYIKAIFERVNLDYEKVGLNIIQDGVGNALKAYLYQNYQEIEHIYELIDDTIFNAQNYLIKGFYYLINNKYVDFKDTISSLDNIKETLNKEDVGIFMFLVIEYYIKTNQYNDAFKYLGYLESMCFDLSELNWLIYEQHFIVGFNLNKHSIVYKYYNKLMGDYNIGYPNNRQLIIRMMMLDFQADDYFSEVYEEVKQLDIDNIEEEYYFDTNYWKLVIMLKGGLNLEVFDEIIENDLTGDVRFVCLLLYAANRIKDDEFINKAMKISEDYQIQDNEIIHQKFIKYFQIKYGSEKKHPIIEYLKYNIIPYNNTYYHHLYSSIYIKDYVDYLCKTSKYKEALSFYRK